MNNRKLIITWKPDVLNMFQHKGSKEVYPNGNTSRSERDSFRNIKTKESAERIINRRNKKEIIVAKWNDVVVYPV